MVERVLFKIYTYVHKELNKVELSEEAQLGSLSFDLGCNYLILI